MTDEKQNPQTLPADHEDSGRHADGRWMKGAPPGPGRPKKARIKNAIDGQYADKPSQFMIDRVAESLGIKSHEVPFFEEVQQLQVWAFMIRALDGSHEHARELLDRSDPKPSRSHVEIRTSRGPANTSGIDDEEAQEYWEKLPSADDDGQS